MSSGSEAANGEQPRHPLVVDLDGTLVRTDTLYEAFLVAFKSRPLVAVAVAAGGMVRGRATLKAAISALAVPDPASLPYNDAVTQYLRQQRTNGRRLHLATATHHAIAEAVAAHLGVFDSVLATTNRRNLKGKAKLEVILGSVGKPFGYVGDSAADIPIWQAAQSVGFVDATSYIRRQVPGDKHVEIDISDPPSGLTWITALRAHQWLKNLLVFVPLFTSFSFVTPMAISKTLGVFLAFSLVASGTYLWNDLLDLPNDRRHPRKRLRALPAGDIPIAHAMLASLLLVGLGLSAAFAFGIADGIVVTTYLMLTVSYSVWLKHRLIADVIVLAGLYTIRIVAGAVAAEVQLSVWLLAFSVFTFLSLALLKRASELHSASATAPSNVLLPGRGYQPSDFAIIAALGSAASVASVVVYFLFASAPETAERYQGDVLLWFAGIGFLYLQFRLWALTARGQMHDDPVVFMLRNPLSVATLLLVALLVVLAYYVPISLQFIR